MKTTIAIVLAAITVSGCSKTDSSGRIVSKTESTADSALNVHGGRKQVLIVDGKRFENVTGESPYYVSLPENNAILFLVEGETDVFHIYKLDSKEDIAISSNFSTVFGVNSAQPLNTDTVEELDGGKLILCKSMGDADQHTTSKFYDYLDLNLRKVVANRIVETDKTGQVKRDESEFLDEAGKITRKEGRLPPF